MWPMVSLSTPNQSSLVLEDKNPFLSTFIADSTAPRWQEIQGLPNVRMQRCELQVATPAAANSNIEAGHQI